MIPEGFILFVSAAVLLCIVPGPDMVFLLSRTIAQGKKAGYLAALGINVGAYVHLIAAVLGLSALLAASSLAFTLVKWLGAAYLIYLGFGALRARSGPLAINSKGLDAQSHRAIFWQGFWSDVLNPKVATFFLAFLPQFVNPAAGNYLWQLLFLGVTVNMIGIAINVVLVYASGTVTRLLRQDPRIARYLGKAMGLVLLGLGIRLAGE
ncbi:MAG TPA: LysE family translocator [Calditrichia bacterium]|nr:LysE family translocator [Calditrichia bacterium]